MILLNIKDFDSYRQHYSTMSFTDKKTVYQKYYEVYPLQNEFAQDLPWIINVFQQVMPAKVIELGGYEGRLAQLMLNMFPIESWLNLELIKHEQRFQHPNYREQVLTTELWLANISLDCGLFILAHTLEHLSNMEASKLLLKLTCDCLLLISPLWEYGQTWRGYRGAHVLTYGAVEIRGLLSPQYNLVTESPSRSNPFSTNNWCSLWKLKQ